MSNLLTATRRALSDGVRQLLSRPIFLLLMIVVPLGGTWFLLDLMKSGLPKRLPTAMVDLDNTPTSRNITRNLDANELTAITYKSESYADAMTLLKQGKIYGFFMIPENFEANARSGHETTLTYYVNLSYFVPGSLSFKSFKTLAVTTSGQVVATTLVYAGMDQAKVSAMMQPVVTQQHCIGNPWTNYSIYLTNSFAPCLLQLIIFQITAFSILQEVKRGTSIRWMQRAGNNAIVACFGKLAPQFVIFTVIGLAIQSIMYGYWHFPLNGSVWGMIIAMVLLVASSQAFALTVSIAIPDLRYALSVLSLTGILSFSIAGFSFPVDQMYGGVGIFSYILPIRYYFLIYINTALNGYPLYYVRWEYVIMILMLLSPYTVMWKLRRIALKPVYIP